jgi:hypothetical protein
MSLERWAELASQLRELGLVDHAGEPASFFASAAELAGERPPR